LPVIRLYLMLLLALSLSAVNLPLYAAENSLQPISLRLIWKHQFQFAGYYIAKEKGFYARDGLDVSIHEYTHEVNNVQSVLDGETDFAISRSSLLIDRTDGKDIVALLAAFQTSPFMLLTKAFTGINKPEDLKGRRIMITGDAQKSGELMAMLAQAGLKPDDYIRQKHSFNIDDLINDNTDAVASYISNEPYKLVQQGIPYNIMHPADHGFNMYADILFTSGSKLRQSPQIVEKFYRASIEGWKYAFANIPETVELIHSQYNSQQRSRQALLYEAQELKRLAFDDHGNFGTLLQHRFEAMNQVYLITGAISAEADLSDFIYKPAQSDLNLTYDELAYIKSKQSINICVQKFWPPYEYTQQGQHLGIIADLLKLIRDSSGLSLNYYESESFKQAVSLTEQGICDITTISSKAGEQNETLYISKPFINITLAYLSADTSLSREQLNQRVLISSHQTCQYCLDKNVPEQNRIYVDDINTAFSQLRQGKANSLFGSEAHLRYMLSIHEIEDLYIHPYSINSAFSFAINNQQPVLVNILNKSINLITQQQRDRILSRWVSSSVDNGVAARTFWSIMSFIGLISLFFLYRYYRESMRKRIFKEMSETDTLTGVNNRRKMINEMESFINLSNRYGNKLSVIYFDIDDFKMINDQFGHKTGDRILMDLARIISRNTRKTDIFARWGGEEFLILIPESGIDESYRLAESLQQAIDQHDFKLNRKVTCSFGITEYHPDESLDHFIHRADSAMYEAKHAGKGCFCFYK